MNNTEKRREYFLDITRNASVYAYQYLRIRRRIYGLVDSVSEETPARRERRLRTQHAWINYLGTTHAFARRTWALAKRQRPALIIAHNHNSLEAACLVAGRRKSPILYDAVEIPDLAHRSGGYLARYLRHPLGLRVINHYEAGLTAKAAHTMTVSPGLGDWLVQRYGIEQPTVVRNCRQFVELEEDRRIREDAGLKEGEQLVLYLNRIYENQGLEQLIDATALLPPHMVVAAVGPYNEESFLDSLKARAAQKGVAGRFHILPVRDPGDLVSYISGADLSVIPRQGTNLNNMISLPNRIFESVMARLPIAVGRLPEMRSLVLENGMGESFDESEPASIAGAIERILAPENNGRYKAAAENAAKELCWEKEREKYLAVVDRLCSARGPKKVLLCANKPIDTNDRIRRLSSTLVDEHFSVTVVARTLPHATVSDPRVEYIKI